MEGKNRRRKLYPEETLLSWVRIVACLTILGGLLVVGAISLFDEDPTVSLAEKRKLAEMPDFTWKGLADGSYFSGITSHYLDTFPARETLVVHNRTLNKFYFFSPGKQNTLILDNQGNVGNHGEALPSANPSGSPSAPPPSGAPQGTEDPSAGTTAGTGETQRPTTGSFTNGVGNDDVDITVGSTMIIGDRAMEIVSYGAGSSANYADAINRLAADLPADVRVFDLVTPNSGEFYSPADMHTGSHSQGDMIDLIYSKLDSRVTAVDAYDALLPHLDEYLFFRTDHHWTALGAYYAYTAYCQAAGLTAQDLSSLEQGQVAGGFLGSLYTATSAYPQSDALYNHPDTVYYYRPGVSTDMTFYETADMSEPQTYLSTVSYVGEDVQNKYLCFLGGDHPITVIETGAQTGKTCLIIKESYGNAFTPFLTHNYSRVVALDPREFNGEGEESLKLAEFVERMGVDDVLFLNYPMSANSESYLQHLLGLL